MHFFKLTIVIMSKDNTAQKMKFSNGKLHFLCSATTDSAFPNIFVETLGNSRVNFTILIRIDSDRYSFSVLF